MPDTLPIPLPLAMVLGCCGGLSAAFNSPLAGIVFAIEEYMEKYEAGSYKEMVDPFAAPTITTDATVGIDSALLAKLEEEAIARGYDTATLLDLLVRDAFDVEDGEEV